MRELARKLMYLRQGRASNLLPSVIFGTTNDLARQLENRAPLRIGMWPCSSSQFPEAAMGLMAALAHLLERWQDIVVYRVFARLEGEPEAYTWTVDRSQFTIDDWDLDGLDDNVGLWGTLEHQEGRYLLTLTLESDMHPEDAAKSWVIEGDTFGALLNALPGAADSIALALEADSLRIAYGQPIPEKRREETEVIRLLAALFSWEIDLLLLLWGKAPQVPLAERHAALLNTAAALSDSLGAWVAGAATARAFYPGFALEPGADLVAVSDTVALFPHAATGSSYVSVALARALFRRGDTDEALQLLETAAADAPHDVDVWQALAELYRARGDYAKAVDTYQRAIEADAVSARLYTDYGTLLPLMENAGYRVEEFILIEPSAYDGVFASYEAISAFEEALQLDPTNAAVLRAQQAALLLDVERGSVDFWAIFEKLVAVDATGEQVRSVVDQFTVLDDPEPGLQILETASDGHPERADVRINLAAAYLIAEEYESAAEELETAQKLTQDAATLHEIDRLLLSADDPEFEMRFGEIMDRVSAEAEIDAEEATFLEEVIAAAPGFTEAYMLLSRAYVLWEEHDSALQTLLDAEKHLPDDPEILEGIARLLWRADQHELALEYLDRGVKANPSYVPLLAFAGQCLVEDGQDDAARIFLARAESLDSNHPALRRAREAISRLMSED